MQATHVSDDTITEDAGNRNSMTGKPISVLIIDDHPVVREGLKNLLLTAKDIMIVGEGSSGSEAIDLVITKNPDILLLDMELPDQRGDVVMHRIHDMQPDMKVLAVSSYSDRDYIIGMMEQGAAGYITKDEAPTMLVDAIRNIIYEGGGWFSPLAILKSTPTHLEQQTLTKREVQILQHLVRDRSMEEIAAAIGMGKVQVENYLRLLMRKYETESILMLKQIAHRILSRRTP